MMSSVSKTSCEAAWLLEITPSAPTIKERTELLVGGKWIQFFFTISWHLCIFTCCVFMVILSQCLAGLIHWLLLYIRLISYPVFSCQSRMSENYAAGTHMEVIIISLGFFRIYIYFRDPTRELRSEKTSWHFSLITCCVFTIISRHLLLSSVDIMYLALYYVQPGTNYGPYRRVCI